VFVVLLSTVQGHRCSTAVLDR